MGYLLAWVFLVVGMVAYRMLNPDTDTSVHEHIAGAYFSAIALAGHAFIFKDTK
jgi:hypothetical protein